MDMDTTAVTKVNDNFYLLFFYHKITISRSYLNYNILYHKYGRVPVDRRFPTSSGNPASIAKNISQ